MTKKSCFGFYNIDFDYFTFQTFFVYIMDITFHILRNKFENNHRIKRIPMHNTLGGLLEYVVSTYFDPPLEDLKPYAYPARIGKGKPFPLGRGTTISMLMEQQKDRHVSRNGLTVIGKVDLSKLYIAIKNAFRYKAAHAITQYILFTLTLFTYYKGIYPLSPLVITKYSPNPA